MHTFELASPKVSISLRFPMQKKDFLIFRLLFAPANCLTNYRFTGRLFKFLVVYIKKRCTLSKQKTFFANFGNYSKGIFGNHLTQDGYQDIKFCDTIESWKWLGIVAFFLNFLSEVILKLEQ